MAAFVKPGERIGLKPNIILPAAPDKAICTHPLLVAAVALAVREAGGYPVVVESPGAGIVPLKSVMVGVFRRAGYREVADRYDFELSYDTDWDTIRHPDGRHVHRVELLRSFLDCDGLINLSKFKTHTFQVLSGATKNLFGLIPGLTKVGYHAKLPDPKLLRRHAAGRRVAGAAAAEHRGRHPGHGGAGPEHLGHAAADGLPAGRRRLRGRRRRLLRHRRHRPAGRARCWPPPATAGCGGAGRKTWPRWGCRCRSSR